MIQAEEAIRAARGLIGTSYETLDCINLIKKVIRTCAGGDKRYTTAGTNALWDSDSKRGKYRDLTWKQAGISGAKPGMLAFMGVGTGDVNHTGLVTERGTVIHSSKSRGGVVETALTEKAGWNGLGVHRMIGVDYSEGGGKAEVSEAEKIFGNATVNITSGYLNIRDGASTRSNVIAKAANGTRVNIIREAGGTGWVYGALASGETGYMSREYLVEDAPGAGDAGDGGEDTGDTTTLTDGNGAYVTLVGRWKVTND